MEVAPHVTVFTLANSDTYMGEVGGRSEGQ